MRSFWGVWGKEGGEEPDKWCSQSLTPPLQPEQSAFTCLVCICTWTYSCSTKKGVGGILKAFEWVPPCLTKEAQRSWDKGSKSHSKFIQQLRAEHLLWTRLMLNKDECSKPLPWLFKDGSSATLGGHMGWHQWGTGQPSPDQQYVPAKWSSHSLHTLPLWVMPSLWCMQRGADICSL